MLVVLALVAPASAGAADPKPYEPTTESLARHPLPAWWQDGKFGIFIHWGPYSVPAYAPTGYPQIAANLSIPPAYTPYAEFYWFVQQIPASVTWLHHLQTYGGGLRL